MEYHYNDCENNQRYLGSSVSGSNNLNQFESNPFGDRRSAVFQQNNLDMSHVAQEQLPGNSTTYDAPERNGGVGAVTKISMSNHRIFEDLSHSRPLYVTSANDINLQKCIQTSNTNLSQTLFAKQQEPLIVPSLEAPRQSMDQIPGGTCSPENSSTSIHISFSENYLHEQREQHRSQSRHLDLNEISHSSHGTGNAKVGSRY